MRGTGRVIVLQAWSYGHLGIGEGEANAVASVNLGTQGDGRLPQNKEQWWDLGPAQAPKLAFIRGPAPWPHQPSHILPCPSS